jgi:hypothetical protein
VAVTSWPSCSTRFALSARALSPAPSAPRHSRAPCASPLPPRSSARTPSVAQARTNGAVGSTKSITRSEADCECALIRRCRRALKCNKRGVMAIYHFSAKVISRANGSSAVASAAYRSASELHDDRLGRDHDFSTRPACPTPRSCCRKARRSV